MLLSHQYYWCSSPAMALFAQQGNFDTFLHFLSAFIVRYAEAGCRCAPHGRRVKTGEPARRHRHQRQLTLLYSSRAVTLLLKRFPDSILCYAASWTMYCSQFPPLPSTNGFQIQLRFVRFTLQELSDGNLLKLLLPPPPQTLSTWTLLSTF